MTTPPRVLEFDDVIELCGSVATSRGQVYKASGRVQELDWSSETNVLNASVQGSDAEPYAQRITIAPHRFDGECSCPVRYNCKHVAAALLAWIERQTAAPSPDDQTLRAVNRWLQKVVEQGRKSLAAHEHHEPGEPLLFYQLDDAPLTQQKRAITLQVLQSRLLKRGGYGKETPYRYNGHYYHPDWVMPSDRAILELAVGRQSDLGYRTLTVEGDIGHLLMGKLVETGRAFWGADRERALARGPARRLAFDWHAERARRARARDDARRVSSAGSSCRPIRPGTSTPATRVAGAAREHAARRSARAADRRPAPARGARPGGQQLPRLAIARGRAAACRRRRTSCTSTRRRSPC